jgi:dihydroceramidase
LPDGQDGAVARGRLLAIFALAATGAAVAWACTRLPGTPAACSAAGCDCEAPGPGPIRQPANAWSSLALSLAGCLLLTALPKAAGDKESRVTAAGTKPGLLARVGEAACLLIPALALLLAGTAAFWFHAGLTAWAARLDGIAVGILIAALAAHRWWPRRAGCSPWAARGVPAVVPWLLLALGAAAWFLGRSGGPWCRPDAPLQAHAAWHLLAAAAIFLWLWRRRPAGGCASPIPPGPLPSRPEDATADEPAP